MMPQWENVSEHKSGIWHQSADVSTTYWCVCRHVNVQGLCLIWFTNEGQMKKAYSSNRFWAATDKCHVMCEVCVTGQNQMPMTDLSYSIMPAFNWLVCLTVFGFCMRWSGMVKYHALYSKQNHTDMFSDSVEFTTAGKYQCALNPAPAPAVFVQWCLCQMPAELTSHSWTWVDNKINANAAI